MSEIISFYDPLAFILCLDASSLVVLGADFEASSITSIATIAFSDGPSSFLDVLTEVPGSFSLVSYFWSSLFSLDFSSSSKLISLTYSGTSSDIVLDKIY